MKDLQTDSNQTSSSVRNDQDSFTPVRSQHHTNQSIPRKPNHHHNHHHHHHHQQLQLNGHATALERRHHSADSFQKYMPIKQQPNTRPNKPHQKQLRSADQPSRLKTEESPGPEHLPTELHKAESSKENEKEESVDGGKLLKGNGVCGEETDGEHEENGGRSGLAGEENEGEEMEQHGDGESCAGNYLIDEHGCEDGEEEEERGDQQKDLGRLFVRKNLLKLVKKRLS